MHVRSPEHFHSLVLSSLRHPNSLQGFDYHEPTRILFETNLCLYAHRAFRGYVEKLWVAVGPENVIVLASEDLERRTQSLAQSLVQRLGWDDFTKEYGGNFTEFTSVRYNTNTEVGEDAKQVKSKYQPGVYNVSHWRPMLPETRALLRRCWAEDCEWTSRLTGHAYACSLRGLLRGVHGLVDVREAAHAKLQKRQIMQRQ